MGWLLIELKLCCLPYVRLWVDFWLKRNIYSYTVCEIMRWILIEWEGTLMFTPYGIWDYGFSDRKEKLLLYCMWDYGLTSDRKEKLLLFCMWDYGLTSNWIETLLLYCMWDYGYELTSGCMRHWCMYVRSWVVFWLNGNITAYCMWDFEFDSCLPYKRLWVDSWLNRNIAV